MKSQTKVGPIHPGEILLEEFMKPLHLSQYRVAMDIGVLPRRINEIVHEARAISADTALRLGRYFRTGPEFWINLQSHYELDCAKHDLGNRIEKEVKLCKMAA